MAKKRRKRRTGSYHIIYRPCSWTVMGAGPIYGPYIYCISLTTRDVDHWIKTSNHPQDVILRRNVPDLPIMHMPGNVRALKSSLKIKLRDGTWIRLPLTEKNMVDITIAQLKQ